MTVQHAAEFERQGITTLEQLGSTPGPLPERPDRGARATYERLREQARVQLEGRKTGRLVHERLPIEEKRGFCRLPSPSAADVFFDIEAARFHEDGGLEYLLGWCMAGPDGDAGVPPPLGAQSPAGAAGLRGVHGRGDGGLGHRPRDARLPLHRHTSPRP